MDQKKIAFLINTAYVLVIIGIVYVIFAHVLGYIMPFLVGFLFAAMFQPLIRLLHRMTKIPIKWISFIVILLFFSLVFFILSLIGFEIFLFLRSFFSDLPQLYVNTILPYLQDLADRLSDFIAGLDPTLVSAYEEFFDVIIGSTGNIISTVADAVVGWISSAATRTPMMLVSWLVTIIVTFFIAIDYQRIIGFIKSQLSEKTNALLTDIMGHFAWLLRKYGKSYLIIVTVTFLELSVGLSILGINNAIIIAFLIAIFDILPVVGTGGIVIPWAIYTLIDGNTTLGIGLLIVYVIVTIVRNVIEPRIVGNQVGLHPVLTLFAMYVGVRLIGFFGLFIAPMSLVILKNLHESGKITLLKERKEEMIE